MRAQHRSSPEGRIAFASLCRRYWYPLYAFVRSKGNDVHQAQDLTQGFFERVMEKNYVGDVDPARGKFRTFLLSSMTHFLANEHDKRMALKRGGDRVHFPLEFEDAERRYTTEAMNVETPELLYEQRWARALLDRVIQDLRREWDLLGKEKHFEELKPFLTIEPADSVSEIAQRLDMTESAVRVAIHRLRKSYRDRLYREIADTLGDTEEVEDEINALLSTFSRHGHQGS